MTEATLEQLPYHELKRVCAEKGIKAKTTDKKAELIKMIRSGESIHQPREVKRMEPLADKTPTVKTVPMIPQDIRPRLEELATRGLKWEIDHEHCCINFMRDLPTCANLDQPSQNILRTAEQAFRGRIGGLAPAIEPSNNLQAQRIDQGL